MGELLTLARADKRLASISSFVRFFGDELSSALGGAKPKLVLVLASAPPCVCAKGRRAGVGGASAGATVVSHATPIEMPKNSVRLSWTVVMI